MFSMLTFLLPGLNAYFSSTWSPPCSQCSFVSSLVYLCSQCLLFCFLISVLTFLLPSLLHILSAYFSPRWSPPCSQCLLFSSLAYSMFSMLSPPWSPPCSHCKLFSSLVSVLTFLLPGLLHVLNVVPVDVRLVEGGMVVKQVRHKGQVQLVHSLHHILQTSYNYFFCFRLTQPP